MAKSFGSAKITIDVIVKEQLGKQYDALIKKNKELERSINASTGRVMVSENKLASDRIKSAAKVTAESIKAEARKEAAALASNAKIKVSDNKLASDSAKLAAKSASDTQRAEQSKVSTTAAALKKRGAQQARAFDEDKKRTFQAAKVHDTALEQNRKKTEQLQKAEKRRSDQIQRNLKKEQGAWEATSKQVGQYAIRIAAVGAAIGGAFLKAAGDQEKSIDMVVSKIADLGASEKELARITDIVTDTVIKASRGLGMTGKAAAEAAVFLAQAGQSAEEIQKNLRPILLLKTTDAFADMRQVADFVTDAMTSLGIESKDTAAFVDQLAFVSAKTNTDLSQMGEAVKFLAPIMGDFSRAGATATEQAAEMGTIIGLLADAGLKGTIATTALKTSLLRFATAPGKVNDALKKYNLSMFDSQGQAKGLTTVLREMADKFKGLSDKERISTLSTIVGTRAYGQFNIILKQAETGLVDLQEQIVNSGGAVQQMADIALDNLTSAFVDMQAEIVKTAASFGDMKKGGAKDFVDGITEMLIGLQEYDDEQKEAIINAAAMLTAITAVTGAIALIVPAAKAAAGSIGLLNVSITGTSTVLKNIVPLAGAFAVGWNFGRILGSLDSMQTSLRYIFTTLGLINEQNLDFEEKANLTYLTRVTEEIDQVTASMGKLTKLADRRAENGFNALGEVDALISWQNELEKTGAFWGDISLRINDVKNRMSDDWANKGEIEQTQLALGIVKKELEAIFDAGSKKKGGILPDMSGPVSGPVSGTAGGVGGETAATPTPINLEKQAEIQAASLALLGDFFVKSSEMSIASIELMRLNGKTNDLQTLELKKEFYAAQLAEAQGQTERILENEVDLTNKINDLDTQANELRAAQMIAGFEERNGLIDSDNDGVTDMTIDLYNELMSLLETFGAGDTEAWKKLLADRNAAIDTANDATTAAQEVFNDNFNRFLESQADDFGRALGDMMTGAKSFEESMSGIFKNVAGMVANILLPGSGGLVTGVLGAFGFAEGGAVGVSGGYTGSGGKNDPAGVVHKGEDVFSQKNVQEWGGINNVEALRVGNITPELMGLIGEKAGASVGLSDGGSASAMSPISTTSNQFNQQRSNTYNTFKVTIVEATSARATARELNNLANRGDKQASRLRGI